MSPCTALVMLLMISASEGERDNFITPKLDSDIARMVRKVDPSWDESTARSPLIAKCIQGVIFYETKEDVACFFQYDTRWAWDVITNIVRDEAL